MAKQAIGTYFKQAEFDTVKKLSGLGLDVKTICGITNRSKSTVQVAKKANSYDEYRSIRDTYIKRSQEKHRSLVERQTPIFDSVAEHETKSEEVVANDTSESVVDVLNKINDSLQALVEAWNTSPDEKPRRLWGK